MAYLWEKIYEPSDAETQKKEGSNGQNIQFSFFPKLWDEPKECSESVSESDYPPEVKWSHYEADKYAKSHIPSADPCWEIIHEWYWSNESISRLFSDEHFESEPKREK